MGVSHSNLRSGAKRLRECLRQRLAVEAWSFAHYILRSALLRAGLRRKEGFVSLLTQHLPLQRAMRALGHAGLLSIVPAGTGP